MLTTNTEIVYPTRTMMADDYKTWATLKTVPVESPTNRWIVTTVTRTRYVEALGKSFVVEAVPEFKSIHEERLHAVWNREGLPEDVSGKYVLWRNYGYSTYTLTTTTQNWTLMTTTNVSLYETATNRPSGDKPSGE